MTAPMQPANEMRKIIQPAAIITYDAEATSGIPKTAVTKRSLSTARNTPPPMTANPIS